MTKAETGGHIPASLMSTCWGSERWCEEMKCLSRRTLGGGMTGSSALCYPSHHTIHPTSVGDGGRLPVETLPIPQGSFAGVVVERIRADK